jgi:NTP pyrophosphatase (non-canonical NTP hydrolase)
MNKKQIYEKVLETFGHDSQLLKLQEEMGECQAAISRMINDDGQNENLINHVIEEIVDVLIVAEQMELELGERFREMKNKKLDRLAFIVGERYETI